MQLAAVYTFEYIIQVRGQWQATLLRHLTTLQTAGAHSANTDCSSQRSVNTCSVVEFCSWDGSTCDYSSSSNGQINKNLFVVLSFCYQFGVLISRSSLSYIKAFPAPSHRPLCKN